MRFAPVGIASVLVICAWDTTGMASETQREWRPRAAVVSSLPVPFDSRVGVGHAGVVRARGMLSSAGDLGLPPTLDPGMGGNERSSSGEFQDDGATLVPSKAPLSYWSTGRVRSFVAARADVGVGYAKGSLAAGYGLPSWMWAGVEGFAITTNNFAGFYTGVRAALPFFDIGLGVRRSYSYGRSLLGAREHYEASDVGGRNGDRARYTTLEIESTAAAPVPGGYAFCNFIGYRVLDVPNNVLLYEEALRAVMRPPYMFAVRLGYLAAFGRNDIVKVGALGEYIGLPGRGAAVTRVGPIAVVTLTDHLTAIAGLTTVLSSPDALGFVHGSYGMLGVAYAWATGERSPRFP